MNKLELGLIIFFSRYPACSGPAKETQPQRSIASTVSYRLKFQSVPESLKDKKRHPIEQQAEASATSENIRAVSVLQGCQASKIGKSNYPRKSATRLAGRHLPKACGFLRTRSGDSV